MVIATHSPVVIASANDENDFCFSAKDNALTLIGAKQTQSVETVLFDDFETYTENNRRVHERCARVVADVITALNGNANVRTKRIDLLRADLSIMAQTVNSSGESVTSEQKRADLELIRRAESAINEILRNDSVEPTIDEEEE